MAESTPKNIKEFHFRAKLPRYVRLGTLLAISVAVFVAIGGFYLQRSKSSFKLKPEHAQLSTDVVAEVTGYERLEHENGIAKYLIRADHAKTFSDDHQELTNVYLEVFESGTDASDRLTADSALYIPEVEKDFTAYLKGNVQIETKDGLRVKTSNITYTRNASVAEADDIIEFERGNIKGTAFGAIVDLGKKKLDLLRDVVIDVSEPGGLIESDIDYAKIKSGSASFDQNSNRIDLSGNVSINTQTRIPTSKGRRVSDIHSQTAVAYLGSGDNGNLPLKRVELFESVRIVLDEPGQSLTTIGAGYAMYSKVSDVFELKGGSHIVTTADEKSTDIKATTAILDRKAFKLLLVGNAVVVQGSEEIKGEQIAADLFSNYKVKHAVIRGAASVRQGSSERTVLVVSNELNATFDEKNDLIKANAVGQSSVEITPSAQSTYSHVVAKAARGIGMSFNANSTIDSLRTDGRTSIQLNVPNSKPDSSNKRVTADTVKAVFASNGKYLSRVEAAGNAELFIEPHNAAVNNYKTTINAPHFDCEFYPTGNNAKLCVAGRIAKASRVPTVPSGTRGTQNLTADQLIAKFDQRSNDIESLEATGRAKFSELDRNAIASRMIFTQSDSIVRLRTGEPTVWDSRARAKAREIDLDTKNNRSLLRGNVSTTYYGQKPGQSSSPFSNEGKPVFITADAVEFDHVGEIGTYIGNARGWQESNYVRGDTIVIDQKAGQFMAEGKVQSSLYNVRLQQSSKETVAPVYASANAMSYDRRNRILQYTTAVDIRQGTDRITSGKALVHLDERYEVVRTIAEDDVVITQPGRRASGSWGQFTAGDEVAILRGSPATISDSVNGSTQTNEITFRMRQNSVAIGGKSSNGTVNRSRSVYKVKTNQ